MNTILLTGATGNLGSRILAEFLKANEDTKFVLLVYGKEYQDAQKQVESVLAFWDCSSDSLNRIEIFLGDITEATLGFSPEDYTRLTEKVTHVIHCAANFKLDLSLEEARKSILEATKNVVVFGKECQKKGIFKKFNYISTLDVAGNLEGVIREEFLTHTKRKFLNTYQIAKSEAEEYLREQHEKHFFPMTIYRPSMLVGDSQNGKIINLQSLYHIINDMFLRPESKILPGKDFSIDPMPLDLISRGMYLMYDAPETVGKVYHFASGYELSLALPVFIDELQKIYQKITGKIIAKPIFISPLVPYMLISLLCFLSFGSLKKKLNIQKDMIQYFFLDVRFDNSQMKSFLEARGVMIPHLKDYLPVLCAYMIKKNPALAALHVAL